MRAILYSLFGFRFLRRLVIFLVCSSHLPIGVFNLLCFHWLLYLGMWFSLIPLIEQINIQWFLHHKVLEPWRQWKHILGEPILVLSHEVLFSLLGFQFFRCITFPFFIVPSSFLFVITIIKDWRHLTKSWSFLEWWSQTRKMTGQWRKKM